MMRALSLSLASFPVFPVFTSPFPSIRCRPLF
jgi:hypothetical protein